MAFRLPRSLFIHIPKTGGQWVVTALASAGVTINPLGPVHTSPDEIQPGLLDHEALFTFAMIRHPLCWYQSMWTHQTDDKWQPIDAEDWYTVRWVEFWAEFTSHCASYEFPEFLRRCLDHYPRGLVSTLYNTYTARCDFVGRQEHLADDLVKALNRAGETFDELRLRNTQQKNVRGSRPNRAIATRYTRELAEALADRERDAIERFNYERIPSPILRVLEDRA